METVFGVKDTIIIMLGRRPDLTTRVPMWQDAISLVRNPIVGYGYESFWLGRRLAYMVENWGVAQQIHNGYLEMYLNMGLVGVFFVFAWIVSGLKKVYWHLESNYSVAMLRLCFIIVVALYNYTEATFFGVSNMWLLLFLGVMEIPSQAKTGEREANR
jgi:O-antigen ligase